MTNSHILKISTRFFDLDSQRHVNNASFLSLFREGQIACLANAGYDLNFLNKHDIYLKPDIIHIIFLRQQLSQTGLEVHTNVHSRNKKIYWNQEIYNPDAKEIAVKLYTVFNEKKNVLDKLPEAENRQSESLLDWDILNDFSGSCQQSVMNYSIRHIDLDGFNQCSDLVLWRLNEEARWNFLKEINLPLLKLIDQDISLFWISGVCHYFSDIQLYDQVQVFTWISNVSGARIYIRQEIIKNKSERVLRVEGEFLTVSLSRTKPTRIPGFLYNAMKPYMEKLQ